MSSPRLRFSLAAFAAYLLCAIAHADLAITFPPAGGAKIASCDDYATAVLNNPWDMNDARDINTYIPTSDFVNFTSVAWGGGVFSAVAATNDPWFHLLSPPLCSAQPASGRFGSDYPIDSAKYHLLTLRMFTEFPSHMQIIWNFGCDYFNQFVVSAPIATKPGWHVYTIDLNTIARAPDSSVNLPWNAAPVTGLRIDPTAVAGAHVFIDWISLSSDTSCGNATVRATATPSADETQFNLYLDNDADPLNGFVKQLATAETAAGEKSVSVTARALESGDYRVNGFLSSDYALLHRTNPWDMSDADDVYVTDGITSPTFSGGVFTGTTASRSSLIYLKLSDAGIPAANFSKLSLRLTQTANANAALVWVGANGLQQLFLTRAAHDPDGDGIFQVDLASHAGWRGTVTTLALSPADAAGVQIGLDFITLRSQGFRKQLSAPSILSAAGPLTVNRAPLVTILQPDAKGGEGFAAWNMGSPNHIALTEHLSFAEILPFNLAGGLVGDFFHGANMDGVRDPINYNAFFTINPAGIDTSRYHNLTYKLLVEGRFDLVEGSVARVNWSAGGSQFGTTQDLVVFEGWNEYTVDLATAARETPAISWSGTVNSFRIDAHEFKTSRPYYYDYIHLRADDRANDRFLITLEADDLDGTRDSLQVSLYYNTSKSTQGGTLITSSSYGALRGAYLWNTAGLAEGSYYVYAVVGDGLNATTRFASGHVTVARAWQDIEGPILSLEAPAGQIAFDAALQLKGYALDRVELAEVRVLLDGSLFTRIRPTNFHRLARDLYPQLLESNNSGFNRLYDTSAISYGEHWLTAQAIDTAGNITEQVTTVTRAPGANPTIIPDEIPDGASIPVTRRGATDVLLSPLRVSTRGSLSGRVDGLSEGCTVSLLAGRTADSVNTRLKGFRVTSSQAVRGVLFRGSRITGYNGALFARAVQQCGSGATGSSEVVPLTFRKRAKKSYSTVIRSLRKQIQIR